MLIFTGGSAFRFALVTAVCVGLVLWIQIFHFADNKGIVLRAATISRTVRDTGGNVSISKGNYPIQKSNNNSYYPKYWSAFRDRYSKRVVSWESRKNELSVLTDTVKSTTNLEHTTLLSVNETSSTQMQDSNSKLSAGDVERMIMKYLPHKTALLATKEPMPEAPIAPAQLTETQLAGAQFSREQIAEAPLARAQLTRGHLTGAQLTGTQLTEAQLAKTQFSGEQMAKAPLAYAQLERTPFGKTQSAGAQFAIAPMAEPQLTRAQLAEAQFLRSQFLKAQLAKSPSRGAILARTRLPNVPMVKVPPAKASTVKTARAKAPPCQPSAVESKERVKTRTVSHEEFAATTPEGAPEETTLEVSSTVADENEWPEAKDEPESSETTYEPDPSETTYEQELSETTYVPEETIESTETTGNDSNDVVYTPIEENADRISNSLAKEPSCKQVIENKTVICEFLDITSMNLLKQALVDASGFFTGFSITITNSDLNAITPHQFKDLNIRAILLDFNYLSQVPWTAIGWIMPGLHSITITNSLIYWLDIPKENLRVADSIEILDVGLNEIQSLKVGSFSIFKELTNLKLDGNNITKIESRTFTGLSKLTTLQLDNCHIRFIEVNAFEGLGSLETLHLRSNAIISLPEGVFNGLDSLREIQLHRNPFFCLWDLRWLKSWLVKSNLACSCGAICVHPAPINTPLVDHHFGYS